jgi:large subunit ribosomal protein L23
MVASKEDIKSAVQELFNVRVVSVNTQIRHGKKRRYRMRVGQMGDWKRAIVTLHEEDKIEFF